MLTNLQDVLSSFMNTAIFDFRSEMPFHILFDKSFGNMSTIHILHIFQSAYLSDFYIAVAFRFSPVSNLSKIFFFQSFTTLPSVTDNSLFIIFGPTQLSYSCIISFYDEQCLAWPYPQCDSFC